MTREEHEHEKDHQLYLAEKGRREAMVRDHLVKRTTLHEPHVHWLWSDRYRVNVLGPSNAVTESYFMEVTGVEADEPSIMRSTPPIKLKRAA